MSFVSSIVGGILGANAAGDAASTESKAAQQAQQLELKNQQAAQNFQQGVWSGTQGNENPYLNLGAQNAQTLQSLTSTPGKGLLQGYGSFQAPTLAQAEQTPGYQFALQQGTRAIDENAAANGTLMSGNTGTALQQYGQGLAQNAYQQTYNNAFQNYQTNFNTFNQNQQNQYARLFGTTGLGQGAATQTGALGQSAAGTMAGIDLTGGQQQAQQINNAAAARASGILGQANAYSNMAGGIAGGLTSGLGNLDTTGGSSWLEQLGNFAGMA